MTAEEMIDIVRNEYIEQIYALHAEVERKSKELELYKKAYDLLSEAYCDKGDCWVKCKCYGQCISSISLDYRGADVAKELFLQKARE